MENPNHSQWALRFEASGEEGTNENDPRRLPIGRAERRGERRERREKTYGFFFILLSASSDKFIPYSTLGRDLSGWKKRERGRKRRSACCRQVTGMSFVFLLTHDIFSFIFVAYPRTEPNIHLELQDTDLWSRFESLSTEMMCVSFVLLSLGSLERTHDLLVWRKVDDECFPFFVLPCMVSIPRRSTISNSIFLHHNQNK